MGGTAVVVAAAAVVVVGCSWLLPAATSLLGPGLKRRRVNKLLHLQYNTVENTGMDVGLSGQLMFHIVRCDGAQDLWGRGLCSNPAFSRMILMLCRIMV